MAEALTMESFMKSCINCEYFRWEQPFDRNSIKQCSKCKMVMYCSWQCQREHWENVHKHQCKYIAKLKTKPKSVHVVADCSDCKLEVATGRVELCNPENPVLKCPFGENPDFGFGISWPLGEMTGQFVTKAEATVSLMPRILQKLKDIHHTAWVVNPKSSEELCQVLIKARFIIWTNAYMLANPGPVLDKAVGWVNTETMLELDELIGNICKLLIAAKFEEQNEFRPWDTLKLLASFLGFYSSDLMRISAEILGLPELSEDLVKIRVSSDQYSGLWQRILDTLNGRLVPYIALVEVLCGGQLKQKCYECLEETIVSDVFMIGGGSSTLDLDCVQGPVLMFGRVTAALCDDQECLEQGMDKLFQHDIDLYDLYAKKGVAAISCDYCGVPGAWNRGHRCSRCLTKVYCGEECRDKDWVVHRLVCKEGEEKRKRKGGQQDRKRQGKDRVRNHFHELEKS